MAKGKEVLVPVKKTNLPAPEAIEGESGDGEDNGRASQQRRRRPSKNNAPATMPGAPPSFIFENFHRDAVWRGDRLFFRDRVVASIVPDRQWPGMWRTQLPNGYLSDIVNRSRAKDAALTLAYTAALDGASRIFSEAVPKTGGSRIGQPLPVTARRRRKVRI